MAAPTPVYYTIKAYEKIVENLNPTAEDEQGTQGGWIEITTDSKLVNYKHPVKYVLQFFLQSDINGSDPLEDSQGVNIAGQNGGEFKNWVDANADKLKVKGWDTYSNNRFELIVTAKVKSTSGTPKFKAQTIPNSPLNTSPNYYTVNIKAGKKIPSIKFTEAQSEPNKPNEVKNDVTEQGQGYTQWNECKKEWVVVTYAQTTKNNVFGYDVYLIKRDINGTQLSKQLLGFEPSTATKRPYSDIGRKALQEAYQCVKAAEDAPNVPTPSVTVQEYPQDERINPPNHRITRDVSLSQKLYYSLSEAKRRGSKTNPGLYFANSTEEARQRAEQRYLDSTARGRLGTIFQDKDSAIALNTNNDDKKPWGFRFIYNPQTIEYSTGADMSVDWMLSSKDPANYIGGNTVVNFMLYLNRIADMTELRHLKSNPTDYINGYPRKLTAESVAGLLNRGTEYDIEFLYRVLNGSPRPSINGLLTYTVNGKPAVTSDFGYITGTPVWIRFHENLRYKGSINSISVNHLIFNEEMVPMFSTMSVSFTRYPITGETDPAVIAAYSEKIAKDLKAGEEPPRT